MQDINGKVKDLVSSVGAISRKQAEHEKVINALDKGKASKALAAFESRIGELSKKLQVSILKNAVFSGLIMMTKKASEKEIIACVMWFYKNETAPDQCWSVHEGKPLGEWHKMAIGDVSLDKNVN